MSFVKVYFDENKDNKKELSNSVDRAIKELKKRLKKEGMFEELKRREYYMSPSTKRKFRKNEAFKRRKREERKQEWHDKKQSS